jgi:hypothetical protein
MWLEYYPLVAIDEGSDIGPQFAATWRMSTSRHVPFTIGYLCQGIILIIKMGLMNMMINRLALQ